MTKNFGFAAAAFGAVALLGATALPASAANTGGTDATFTMVGGSLDVTPAAGAAPTDGAPGAASVSRSLGAVGVTRGSTAGWRPVDTEPAPSTRVVEAALTTHPDERR